VLFNEDFVGVVAEEELIGFVIVEVAAIDHESGEGGEKKCPDDKYDMKNVHCDSPSVEVSGSGVPVDLQRKIQGGNRARLLC
jgi:hypothetical protein